jgi:peptidyl-prolyl cis-trans isomerase C
VTLRILQISALAACGTVGLAVFSLSAQDAPAAAPADAAIASFQGGAITRADYERVAAIKVLGLRLQLAKSDDKRRELLESMIDYELLLLEAERRGYAKHPAVTHAMREESVRRLLEGPLTVAPESIPEADVEAAYDERIKEFVQPEKRRARHVIVATEAEAKALIAAARKPGTDASELIARTARDKSLDESTKRQSGELGFFNASGERLGQQAHVHAAIARAAFAIRKPGEVAGKPVALKEGFSVVVLVDRVAAMEIPPAEAKASVRGALAEQRSHQAADTVAAELEKTHPVQLFPERNLWITLDRSPTADMPQGFSAAPPDPTAPPVLTVPDGF